MSDLAAICRRLEPGADLRQALLALTGEHELAAATLVSVVGSLSQACLRLAGAASGTKIAGPLEIVSGTGTLSPDGLHIHLVVADAQGTTYGGHLLPGCLILTTVELVVLDLSAQVSFARRHDERTGYPELVVEQPGRR